jgi:hypothetical protein
MKYLVPFKSLLFEKDKLSLGRISFWIVFGILVWYWIRTGLIVEVNVTIPDAPDSLQFAFLYLLAYNMGKKFKGMFGKNKEIEFTETEGE